MTLPIAIFYHTCFFKGPGELFPGVSIIYEQMSAIEKSGLLDAAEHFCIGVNGGDESQQLVERLLPKKAVKVMHGLGSKNENLTIVEMEKWLPGHECWNVLYLHCKGVSYDPQSEHGKFDGRWRSCMMHHLVNNWQTCVKDLDDYDSVGCHWMTWTKDENMPHGQSIWAGNFWWARSEFLMTLPSILLRDRIKMSGIGDRESRYEAEVWIGNGPALPVVKDYHPNGLNLRALPDLLRVHA